MNMEEKKELQLKARLCRSIFRELKSFLKEFDISDVSARLNNYEDTFNMRFLLQVCEHSRMAQEEIIAFRNKFKWALGEVKDRDLLIAINKYFDITSDYDDLRKLRNILVKNVTQLGNVEPYDFDDNTTWTIFNYFNIPISEKETEMGKQTKWFDWFIKNAYQIEQKDQDKPSYLNKVERINELSFLNAFKLLVMHRNRKSHRGEMFRGDERRIFHKFIIYTHIGLIYVCQRIWNEHCDDLLRIPKYKVPKCLDNWDLGTEEIEIIIKANTVSHNISNCKYKVNDGNEYIVTEDAKNEIRFPIQARKYDPIIIHFTCDNEEYFVNRTVNYYWWNPILEITVNPPCMVSYTFKDIAGKEDDIDSKIGELYAKLENFEGQSIVEKKLLDKLEQMEPILQQLQDFSIEEDKLSEREIKQRNYLKNEITAMIGDYNSKFDTINSKVENLGTNQRRIEKIINEHFRTQDNKINELAERIKIIQRGSYKKDRAQFIAKHIIPLLICTFAIIVLFSSPNDYNLIYLEHKFWLICVGFILLLASGGILWYAYNTTTRPSLLSPHFKFIGLTLFSITLITLFGAWIKVPTKSIDTLMAKYDFSKERSKGDNAKAVQLVEDYLENMDDEDARIFLVKYYIDIANDKKKALDVTSPMRLDFKKYPKGSLYAAEALYENGEHRHVGEFIERYKSEYGRQMENTPAELNRLQGIMYSYGQYYRKDLKKGVALLKYAADIQNDSKAQYWMGHISSHVMDQPDKGDVQDTLFNLIAAIKYYRKASIQNPKAALELGTLYADLNMNDSAEYYFHKAIDNSDRTLNIEAKYKMGLLLENKGDSTNNYLAEVIDADYIPALLHAAINKQNHEAAIMYFQDAGRYTGHRYIPPIVFEYVYQGNNGAALDTLRSTRVHGNFNEEFVEGVRATIVEKDSLHAMEYWRLSAEKGCQYAKMICLFRDIEHDIRDNRFRKESLNELKNISSEIMFANVLISNLLQQQGRSFEECNGTHLKNNEISALYYKEAEEFGKKAIAHDHPAGILALNDGRIYGYHFDSHIHLKTDTKKELSYRYMLLRMAPEKRNHIVYGYDLDANIYHVKNNKWPDKTHFDFWIDTAIANDDLHFITNILMNLENISTKDIEKITSATIKFITSETDPKIQELLSLHFGTLRNRRYVEFKDYLLSLEKMYKNDPLKRNIIISCNNLPNGTKVSVPFSFTSTIFTFDNYSILNECGNVAEHFYDKPI